MPLKWIDTHCHLNSDEFTGKVGEVLEEATRAGVCQVLVIGIDVESSEAAVSLAAEHSPVYAVVGIQPNSLDRIKDGDLDRIAELSKAAKVVGIGESGLDRYWNRAPIELQRQYFVRHLELAQQLALPIVIHCREADADVVEVLQEYHASHGPIQGVMHSFCGDVETAQRCLEVGLHISFAGMVTFKKNEALRKVVATIPLDRMLVETDSPYLSPHPLRGKQNKPSHVIHTGACLARLHGVSVEDFARITTENARRLFSLPETAARTT